MMRRVVGRLIIAIGLGLVILGRRIEKPDPPAAKLVILPRRHYRPAPPSRLEVFRLGFSVLFSSARFGLMGV